MKKSGKNRGKAPESMPIGIIFVLALVCAVSNDPACVAGREVSGMKITSPEFLNNGYIPKKFTCDGGDINPALIIENTPPNTKSLVLIVDDPDAPIGTWVHWVVYDIPVVSRIGEASIPGVQGVGTSGTKGYGGPCPPSGTHRYFFKIYALDKGLGLNEGADKKTVEKAMEGHIVGSAELIGLYKRK